MRTGKVGCCNVGKIEVECQGGNSQTNLRIILKIFVTLSLKKSRDF